MDTVIKTAKIYSLPEALAYLQTSASHLTKQGGPSAAHQSWARLEVPVVPLDPIAWLNRQKISIKFLWQDRSATELSVGLGNVWEIHRADVQRMADPFVDVQRHIDKLPPGSRLFGGFAFNEQDRRLESDWMSFGLYRWILPRIEYTVKSSGHYLVCHVDLLRNPAQERDALEQFFSMVTSEHDDPAIDIPQPILRIDQPEFAAWCRLIREILGEMVSGQIEKIVLARRTTLQFPNALNPWAIVCRLRDTAAKCYLFAVQWQEGTVFLGASPECLYRRQGNLIETEALAGTRPRGKNHAQDKILCQSLLGSDKDNREHQLVVQMIRERLQPFCRNIALKSQPEILTLSGGHHLMTRCNGQLRPEITDEQILKTLHPTPAVGGTPRTAALEGIASREPFSRGWYAAPIGYLSSAQSEFCVAIRSGLLIRDRFHLYAGAGIISDSQPESEWEEIEHKLNTFLQILG
jgi:menaquinone-specific isochorismate synthase